MSMTMRRDDRAPDGVLGWVSVDGWVVCAEDAATAERAEELTGRGEMVPLDADARIALAFRCHVCDRMLWDVFDGS